MKFFALLRKLLCITFTHFATCVIYYLHVTWKETYAPGWGGMVLTWVDTNHCHDRDFIKLFQSQLYRGRQHGLFNLFRIIIRFREGTLIDVL